MQSESITDLCAALVKAQSEMEGASKDSTNPHFKSKYADLSAVWDACRKPLTDAGLAIIQQTRNCEGELRLVTMLVHSSGQSIEDEGIPMLLSKQDMQGLGAAMTYARRYGLMAMVGIAPEDDDGNSVSGGDAKPVRAQQKKPDLTDAEKKQKAAEFAQKAVDAIKAADTYTDADAWLATNGAAMKQLEKYEDLHRQVMAALNDKLDQGAE